MKRFIKVMFILALVLCFAVPAFAIKILPYSVPLQDLMRWDKYGVALRLSNPEGETLTVSWPATVDLWNYDGSTWTFNLPSGDTFAFSKGMATTGASSFTLSSAATVGTIRTLTVSQTMTAAATANMVEALYVSLTSNVKTGVWANAIVGKIDYSTSGAAHGMAAAICAEMIPPDGSLARGALYALDLEFGCGTSSTWGSAGPVAFIKMENYGTAGHFSTNAFLFHLVGETSATGDLLYNNTIKCRVGTTTWYLALSSAENSYSAQNAAGPVIVNEAATASNPTLCPNRAEDDTGIGWASDVLHIVLGGVDEYNFSGTSFITSASDGASLGTTTYMWSDLFLASLAVIDFNSDIILTHAANLLTFAGGNFRMGTTDRIEFRDATEYICSLNDGYIDVVAATGLRINSDVYVGENSAGHLVQFYGESSGAYMKWYGPTEDILELVDSIFIATVTDTGAGVNAIYGHNDAGATWTSANQVGVRGKCSVSGAGNNIVSATGVWAGLDFADAIGAGTGLTCALNAEVSSDNVTSPNAIIYIQSLPGAGADFTNVPYLVFSETAGGSGSHILFEVGHAAANTIPDIGEDELFYNDTLQIAVNENAGVRTPFFIPLSTDSGTFTTEYPILTSYAGTSAIVISGDCTNAINITSTGTTFGLLYDADFTAQIGANVEGIKVMLERTADVTVATGSWIGAEFIIKKGDTGWSNKPATNVYGVRIAMDGSCTDASGSVIALRVETQGDGWVEYVGYFSVNNNGTLTGSVISVNAFENAPNGIAIACSNSAVMGHGITFTDVNGGGTITNLLHLEDAENTTNFLLADTVEGCIDSSSGNDQAYVGRITISVAGQTRYLYYYD